VPISHADYVAESNRNYDLGRKHAQDESVPMESALLRLFLSCAHLRLRCEQVCPSIKSFSDWEDNTKAMQNAENVLR